MPWYFPWSENIKKRSCRYILQRYLGQFLEEKLTLDQLTVDLYNGIGSVSNVTLDVQALNELGEQQNLPVEFIDGFISEINVSIPWSNLLNDSSCVEVHGLYLVVQPKQRQDNGASMFESTWSSMTSSIQLAEECLKQTSEQTPAEPSNPVNGVEEFAKTIDSILMRVKLKFLNTIIRLEHLPRDNSIGGAIEMHVKEFSYYDETSTETFDDSPTKPASAYGVKLFSFEGVELYTNEFHASNRTISRSLLESTNTDTCESDEKRKSSSEEIILFGKLMGKQEIKLKVKQKENASGPKIDVEANISTIAILLSPRQLRIICEIISGLMSPHLQDTSNVVNRPRCNQKLMTASDFERVEQELNQNMNPSNLNNFAIKSLHNTTGWSSGGIEEESDDDFQPVKGHYTSSIMSESVANSVTSSYTSSVNSYQFSSKSSEQLSCSYPKSQPARHRDKSSSSESDFSGDIRRFELRLNFLTFVLLHRDILISNGDSHIPEDSSVQDMQFISKDFFTRFITLNLNSKAGRCSSKIKAINKNHFRLLCSTVIFNGDEKSNSSNSEIFGSLSIANFELLEYLLELENEKDKVIELLCLENSLNAASNTSMFLHPDVFVNFKYFNDSRRFAARNRAEMNVNLRHFCTEIDITIIDRLVHILDNFNILWRTVGKSTDVSKPSLNDVHAPIIDNKFEWKIMAPFAVIKFRFPVPDFKDQSETDNFSFWHRHNVHDDVLFVELSELTIQSVVTSHQLAQTYELRAKSVQIMFRENHNEKPIPFIFSGVDDKAGMSLPNGGEGFGWPRMVLRLYPKVGYIELEDEEETLEHVGHMAQSIIQTQKQEPSPFAAKMIKRESDTSHSKSTPNCDGEEIILPGSKEEISEFIEGASHNALLQIDITLPSTVIQIPSKHFYEVVYNRFNNDLMLWTPKSFNESFNVGDNLRQNLNLNFGDSGSMFTSFSMCKSAMKTGTDSEDEDSNENLLFDKEKITRVKKNNASGHQQSKITISIFAGQGVLDVFPHARDSTSNVIPEQFGEIQIMFQEANLFCVSGYKSQPLLNYVCLQINNCNLYHCSLIPCGTEMNLKPFDYYPSKYMLPTIYKTQPGAIVNDNSPPVGVGSTTSDDMLTLAVRVQDLENRVKNICVANSLNGVTIRHRMKSSYTSWLSQLINFFDVIDYPVLDYTPWKVVTQLHQQLVNCVIDYRPLYLPLRAALTVENFNISSNITAKTATSILRFITEEAYVFISRKVGEEYDNPEDLSIDLKNDYVCVVDLGLFELSLRLTENKEVEPQTDLRASNNIVHIRTCADSAVALMELVKYIASDGDLCDANAGDEYKMNKSHESNDDLLVNIEEDQPNEDPDIPCMGRSETMCPEEGVPHLVEEAMNDTIEAKPLKKKGSARKRSERKVEVFFFPDETNHEFSSTTSQVFVDSLSSDEDSDNEFCVVEREVGIGYLGRSVVPEVRLLTTEPIRMVDNHFTVPVSKVDVLKAPKGYPKPMSKYTLREMTIVWHMYGGNDFHKDDEEAKNSETKKQVTIISEKKLSSESLHSFDSSRTVKKSSIDGLNISYSKLGESPSVNFTLPSSSPRLSYKECESPSALYDRHKNSSWQTIGGVNRKHDVLMELKLAKLKYQYEIYPKDTKQASRQVLIVQDVEISDRMASSQINKFLYLHSSSARPKQSHANMVVIKATNIRPELNVSHRQECCLRVSLLPLRLNIDQDSLLFLVGFFSEISGNRGEDNQTAKIVPTAKPVQQPVMNIENVNTYESPSVVANLDDERQSPVPPVSASTPIFIRSFIFSPDVPIRLDYEGKRVDMSHGPLAGLIMGLGVLNCSELRLKRLSNRHGFLGIEKLISYVLSEWLQDIKKNQLPSILGGVGPMYSLVQLVQGIRDLFWLPIEQYQKDGRIVRGLQRGANSFTTSTAMAALELTARLVHAIQIIAETAFDLVSPGPSIRYLRYYDRSGKNDHRKGKSRRHHHKYNQPADIREGVASALQLVKEGFEETAQTLIRVASVENEVKGAVGAVGGIIREMPSAALTPIILATQATSNVLDGVRSHLVPDAKAEAALKWKHDYFS